jgi:hypothetical protein
MVAEYVTGVNLLLVCGVRRARYALLSVLTTNQKGVIAEAAVIFECAKLGVPEWLDPQKICRGRD